MALLTIKHFPDPILKKVSQAVENFTPDLEKFVSDMADTMYDAQGIGLAAVQVGALKRLLILDIGELSSDENYLEGDEESERKLSESRGKKNLEVYINPEIIKKSGQIEYEEGCLSVPGVTALVKRFQDLEIKFQSLKGEVLTKNISDLRAIVFQHELDHLNGIIFPERLRPLRKKMILKKYLKRQQKLEEE